MLTRPYSYLFTVSYFGARFKGWATQKGQPTVQGKIERVFRYVLGHEDFTLLGASRTDSGVSCRKGYFQLFLREKMDFEIVLDALNLNLGGEIRLLEWQEVSRTFNLIHSVKQKTYRYFFSDSNTFQPFASAFLTLAPGINSLEQMKENAALFIGKHDFKAFCKVTGNKTDFVREVFEVSVFETKEFQGDFFPKTCYCFEVRGNGFLYNQVRKMISAIWYSTPGQILERLENPDQSWEPVPTAPPHGLILWETVLSI
ncbi:tRNA pseudouridine(38-40) synthase TruA [Algoriphagus sp. CAU 1675]|uniref:tRNA pseudouridine(38-40) synthase TruA n=1 Tax=Algoriphagus sp. CAU 1675 TaxID=3032597 RepID=UPI0023D9A4EE|nr:tRNA pseudouridine(38-40) synthase TruA [Algoriphagus sp. CAU 1675]MDF2159013.1 tRNA pseudouridine(38-40) synthase TruA [Algoriphagus sp. CAU 1675]